MDNFTMNHLRNWITSKAPIGIGDDPSPIFDVMYSFCREYPEVLERGDDWPTVYRMAVEA